MPERKSPTLPEGFPDLPELKEMAYKALQLIDTAMGIANTGAEALSEEYRRVFDSGGSRRHGLGSRTEPGIPLPERRFPVAV
jgi:hypothetical protein